VQVRRCWQRKAVTAIKRLVDKLVLSLCLGDG
jgi:hypothetical protein